MYKIHPVEEREIAEAICPELKEEEGLFVVNEDGKFTGKGIYVIENDVITINHIDAPYSDARTLMFLGILSYAERRGIKEACCKDLALSDLCQKMGFDEDMKVKLEGFFEPGKHCSH